MNSRAHRFYREPEPLHDLAPCIGCSKSLRETGSPLFHQFAVKRAGLDHRAAVLGGEFAGQAPAQVVERFSPVNVCSPCAETMTVAELLGLVS